MTVARKRRATDAELKGCSFNSQVEITQDDINTIKNQSEDLQALAVRNVATITSMLLKIDVLQTENLGLQEKVFMGKKESQMLKIVDFAKLAVYHAESQQNHYTIHEKSDVLQNEKSALHEKLKTQEEITDQLQNENCKLHEEMKILQEECDKFRDVLSESLTKFKAVCTPAARKPTATASCPSSPQTPVLNVSSQSTSTELLEAKETKPSKIGNKVREGATRVTRGRGRYAVLKVKRTQ